MTTITSAEPVSLARLLTWLSPAFPTGGFAYSHGIEWAVQDGDIDDETTLCDWLHAILCHGSGRSDAILLRHAHEAAADPNALDAIAELAEAACTSRERRTETLGQGSAFVAALAAWPSPALTSLAARIGAERIAYPVAVGTACGAHHIGVDAACTAYLTAITANLISAGVRLIPLGQSAGLRVLAALESTIQQIASATRDAPLDDLGTACFRADIAQMRHETQYTRLFRS